jgi:hypothetical protein
MEARNPVGIGLSSWHARGQIYNVLGAHESIPQALQAGMSSRVVVQPARLHVLAELIPGLHKHLQLQSLAT